MTRSHMILTSLGLIGLALLSTTAGWQRAVCKEAPASLDANTGGREEVVDQEAMQRELQAVRAELQSVRETLARVEATLQQRELAPLSPVTIRLANNSGRPLPHFSVRLESADARTPRVAATGTSDENGLALSRDLPYGDYRMKAWEPTGWSTSFEKITVEFGASLDQTIIAPDPEQRATLTIAAEFTPDRLQGLRFGRVHEPARGTSGFWIPFAPEPGEKSALLAGLPMIGDGIEDVGLEMRIAVHQRLRQPDGKVQTWNWGVEEPRLRLLLLPNGIGRIREIESRRVATTQIAAGFFEPGSTSEDGSHRGFDVVECQRIKFAEALEEECVVEAPLGEAQIAIARVLGRADAEVQAALGQDGEGDIWLEAVLSGSSAWIPRLLDSSPGEWTRQKFQSLLSKDLTLSPDEHRRVVIAPPASP